MHNILKELETISLPFLLEQGNPVNQMNQVNQVELFEQINQVSQLK